MPALLSTVSIARYVAQGGNGGFAELARDPLLALASIALIVVCILWVALGRAISRNLDRHELRQQKKVSEVRPPRDIWRDPPP